MLPIKEWNSSKISTFLIIKLKLCWKYTDLQIFVCLPPTLQTVASLGEAARIVEISENVQIVGVSLVKI